MDLIDKNWNALKITYMGDNRVRLLDMTIEFGDSFIIHIDNIALVLTHFSKEDRDSLIYNKILYSYNKNNMGHIELIKRVS